MTLMITEIPLPAPPFDLLRQEADRAKRREYNDLVRGSLENGAVFDPRIFNHTEYLDLLIQSE